MKYWLKAGLVTLGLYVLFCIGVIIYAISCSDTLCWFVLVFMIWPWFFIFADYGNILFFYLALNVVLSFCIGAIISIVYKKIKK